MKNLSLEGHVAQQLHSTPLAQHLKVQNGGVGLTGRGQGYTGTGSNSLQTSLSGKNWARITIISNHKFFMSDRADAIPIPENPQSDIKKVQEWAFASICSATANLSVIVACKMSLTSTPGAAILN